MSNHFQTTDGYHFYRVPVDGAYVWRDSEEDWDMEFADRDGYPIDDQGARLAGEFIAD